jgi:hypothetical protein
MLIFIQWFTFLKAYSFHLSTFCATTAAHSSLEDKITLIRNLTIIDAAVVVMSRCIRPDVSINKLSSSQNEFFSHFR